MILALALVPALVSSGALAGDIEIAVDPAALALHRSTWAVYGSGGVYGGLVTLDGSPTKEGGAVLVARYLAPGQAEAGWLEGVTVDTQGLLVSVVRREGRRMRTLSVLPGRVTDVVTEGREATPLSSRDHQAEDSALSPWLLPLVLPTALPRSGDTWKGSLLAGDQVSVPTAVLTAQGKQDVGGGRKALVAQLVPAEGHPRTVVYGEDGVTAMIDSQAGVQWVAGEREALQAAHAGK
ncbi:hypothetical protein L6R53_26550 [Myxococcota bacterium]|nr:hypothetical protein [Myxococcota bacterium]